MPMSISLAYRGEIVEKRNWAEKIGRAELGPNNGEKSFAGEKASNSERYKGVRDRDNTTASQAQS